MTVMELYALLQSAVQAGQGQAEVVVRAQDDGGSDYCGGIGEAGIQTNEDGPYFAIDCFPEDSDDYEGDEDGAGEGDEAGEEAEEEEGGGAEEEGEEEEEPKS
jgi:hypothetical protein